MKRTAEMTVVSDTPNKKVWRDKWGRLFTQHKRQQKHRVYDGDMKDVTTVGFIEIDIREDGRTMWINIDGMCAVRIQDIRKEITIVDNRKNK